MDQQNKKPVKGSFAALMSQQPPPPPIKAEEKRPDKREQIVRKEKKPARTPAMKAEKKECQLNAWITARQNGTLDRVYFQLRVKGVKIKKGELVGVGIEMLAGILERFNPKTIDATLLDDFLAGYEKKQHTNQP